MSGHGERERVRRIELQGLLRGDQSHRQISLGCFRSPFAEQQDVPPGFVRPRLRVGGVQRDGSIEESAGSHELAFVRGVEQGEGAQNTVVRVEAAGGFTADALGFGFIHTRFDGRNDARGDAVLKFEQLGDSTIEPVRPDRAVLARVDQVDGDAQLLDLTADAAVEDVSYPKLGRDLPHVGVAVAVR